MRAQTELAIEEADVSLLVFDAREGLTPLDTIFAEHPAPSGTSWCWSAANKSEGKAGDHGAAEANVLGLGEPIQISAASTARAWPSSMRP